MKSIHIRSQTWIMAAVILHRVWLLWNYYGNSYHYIFCYSISIFTISGIILECAGSVSEGSSTPETNKRLFTDMLTDMSNKESFDSADLSLAYKRKKKEREEEKPAILVVSALLLLCMQCS